MFSIPFAIRKEISHICIAMHTARHTVRIRTDDTVNISVWYIQQTSLRAEVSTLIILCWKVVLLDTIIEKINSKTRRQSPHKRTPVTHTHTRAHEHIEMCFKNASSEWMRTRTKTLDRDRAIDELRLERCGCDVCITLYIIIKYTCWLTFFLLPLAEA